MTRTILVVGPGWLGAPTATHLAEQGHRVHVLSRSGNAVVPGCHAVAGDITQSPESWRHALPDQVDALVVCVAPSSARGDSYAIYPAAAAGAARLAALLHVRTLLWVSSTGIYDRHDGSQVTEATPIEPRNDRVQALWDAECLVAAAALPDRTAYVLRPAGLYGPGRDPGPRFAAGSTPPSTWCNFSWRDDVRDAMAHLLSLPTTGGAHTFNCTDDHPVRAADITQALTGQRPSAGATSHGDGPVRSGRSNQRIRSTALLGTGWTPRMRTVFDGLRALGHALPGLETT